MFPSIDAELFREEVAHSDTVDGRLAEALTDLGAANQEIARLNAELRELNAQLEEGMVQL